MSTAPRTSIWYPHSDGGKRRDLQRAETTADHWAIVVSEWMTHRGTRRFEVLRVNPRNISVRLSLHNSEAEARAAANREWAADRTAMRKVA